MIWCMDCREIYYGDGEPMPGNCPECEGDFVTNDPAVQADLDILFVPLPRQFVPLPRQAEACEALTHFARWVAEVDITPADDSPAAAIRAATEFITRAREKAAAVLAKAEGRG